jgi:thioredoxin 1
MVENINAEQFEKELKENENLVVDFWAPWCGPCRMIAPLIDNVAKKVEGKVKIVKLNIDESREVALRYNIMSIPTVIFFKDGKVKDKFLGMIPEQKIEDFINRNV